MVALNIAPQSAILCDTNLHILRFYEDLKTGKVSSSTVRLHLESEDKHLREGGQTYYNEVRARFNETPNSLDFLFLNRSCFNGVMRFNRRGKFNVPFCHKTERFAQAYVTKITNQVRSVERILLIKNWQFVARDFRETLATATEDDFLYLDPPYFGRHVDYFNSWSMEDEDDLIEWLKSAPCRWMLSTWHSNQYRTNPTAEFWEKLGYYVYKTEHFYHVGSSESLRHPMTESIVTNYKAPAIGFPKLSAKEQQLALSLTA